jgi:hypothetical protein
MPSPRHFNPNVEDEHKAAKNAKAILWRVDAIELSHRPHHLLSFLPDGFAEHMELIDGPPPQY